MTFLFNHQGIKPLRSIAFELFNLEVRWYGILIVFGAILAYAVGLRAAKRLNVKENDLLDGFVMGLIIGVIGARIWYVIFEWDNFKYDLSSIFFGPWQGLAIHGGIVAGSIFAFFYCKWKKINPLKIAELLFPGFFIGQIFGRWGNFFNQEAHGGLVPGATLDAQRAWLDKFLPDFIVNQMYINGGYYHPTFLYESLWNIVGLSIIFILRKFVKKYWVGDAMFFYLMWYSIGRFFIEGMRTDSLYVFGLRTAQLTSIILFAIGAVGFTLRRVYNFYPVSYKEFSEEI